MSVGACIPVCSCVCPQFLIFIDRRDFLWCCALNALASPILHWSHYNQLHFAPAKDSDQTAHGMRSLLSTLNRSNNSRKLEKLQPDCTTQSSLFGTPEITQVTYAELAQIAHSIQIPICRFPFESRTHSTI